MNIASHFRAPNINFNPEAEKQETFVKRVKARIEKFKEDFRKYYSKVGDRVSSAIGRIRTGVSKAKDGSTLAALWKNPILAMMVFDSTGPSLIEDAQKLLTSLYAPTAIGHNVSTPSMASRIEPTAFHTDFETSVAFVDKDLATAFEEHVSGAKLAAEATAISFADETFIGAPSEKMHVLTTEFLNESISRKDFVNRAYATLLERQGIRFSAEHDDYAIKADSINSIFKTSSSIPTFDGNTFVIFKEAADLSYSEKLDSPQLRLKPTNHLVYKPATLALAA